MCNDAKKQLRLVSHRKGSIEVHTLVTWIILLVFLVLVLTIVAVAKNDSANILGKLCEKTGGFIGC
jgi:hypothetical protein